MPQPFYLVQESPYLLDHNLQGSEADRVLFALRREGYGRMELVMKDRSPFTRCCKLINGITPQGALQQALYDVTDGVSLSQAQENWQQT